MKSQPPTARKLRLPGKLVIPHPQPAAPAPPKPLPACVAARERFIKRFLAVTGLLTLLGNLIFTTRCSFSASSADLNIFLRIAGIFMGLGSYAMVETPVFAILLIPSRNSRSSLLRLVALILPLSVAIAACGLCGAETHLGWGYGAFICMLSIYGMLFLYLPGFLLHFALTFIRNYLRRR